MYIDPNFGSMIIQLVVALIAGFGAYILMFRNKVSSLVFRKQRVQEETVEKNDEEVEDEN